MDSMKAPQQIANELGITGQTVRNVLRSDEEEIKEFLEGAIDNVGEHIAGGFVKLAFKGIKTKKSE